MNAIAIGNRLRDLRGSRSRREVADAVNVGESAITMYELGERIPRDEIKQRLARYFGVSEQALFFNEDVT